MPCIKACLQNFSDGGTMKFQCSSNGFNIKNIQFNLRFKWFPFVNFFCNVENTIDSFHSSWMWSRRYILQKLFVVTYMNSNSAERLDNKFSTAKLVVLLSNFITTLVRIVGNKSYTSFSWGHFEYVAQFELWLTTSPL